MSFRDPNPVTSTPGSFSDPAGFALNTRIMLTATIIILFFVILMASLHLYSRCYLHHRSRRSRRAAVAMTFFADPSSSASAASARGGLDPSVVKSLPTFTFSAATAATECAVCLSEFEESEPGRVLPDCKHAFHVECIDTWFHSHSSCPLCRSLVEPVAGGVKTPAEEEEVAISISDPVSGIGAGTSESFDHEDSMRKPAASEVSRRNIGESENELTRNHGESENELTRSHSFRSRVMSSTRIFSKERRSASSSSIVGCPPVCSMPATELDIESGGEETR